MRRPLQIYTKESSNLPSQHGSGTASWGSFWQQKDWIIGVLLVIAVMVAYLPVCHAGFVWLDDQNVTQNVALRSFHGLWNIWCGRIDLQYYPLAMTVRWIEYHLWGTKPIGYHLVNVFCHSCNAILFWLILRRLRVPGPSLAAGIFALHPVCVESVAWVTEMRNDLSCFFYLSSILVGLEFWLPEGTPRPSGLADGRARIVGAWRFYWLALGLYVLALLSKTAAVPLPAVMLLLIWWKQGKIVWRHVFPLLTLFIVGLGMGLVTIHVETELGAAGKHWHLPIVQRVLIAGLDVWFYLEKLILPHPLIFTYPKWTINASDPLVYIPFCVLTAALYLLWRKRHRWGRPMLVAFIYFVFLLFPVLGFFNIYYFRYSFVADHFQYFASLGPLALVAAGIGKIVDHLPRGRQWIGLPLCGLLLAGLGALTWRQCGMYSNLETLWRVTLAQNPDCWMAENNLGYLLLHQGQLPEALHHLQKAVELEPNDTVSEDNLGSALLAEGDRNDAVACFQRALKIQPDFAPALNNVGKVLLQEKQTDKAINFFHKALGFQPGLVEAAYNLGNALLQKGELDAAIRQWQTTLEIQPDYALAYNNLGDAFLHQGQWNAALNNLKKAVELQPNLVEGQNNLGTVLIQEGQPAEAIQHFTKALNVKPDFVPAQNNLAWVLATCSLKALRNGHEAVELAEHANQLSGNANPIILRTLAAAYAETGQFVKAVSTAQRAVHLAAEQNNAGLADSLQGMIKLFQNGTAFRESVQTQGTASTR